MKLAFSPIGAAVSELSSSPPGLPQIYAAPLKGFLSLFGRTEPRMELIWVFRQLQPPQFQHSIQQGYTLNAGQVSVASTAPAQWGVAAYLPLGLLASGRRDE